MASLLNSLISVIIVSLISFVGIIFIFASEKTVNKILLLLVSFSAGSMMGTAFFHLIPEALSAESDFLFPAIYILAGFCLFFLIERILRWHHCHKVECETHKHLGQLNLIGDGIHNSLDGLVIISAFTVSPALGIPVVLSIIFHEIPQEIGDFGVLLYSGFRKTTALLYNFITALTALLGVIIGYFLLERVDSLTNFLLPFAAGGFIYIAASDLVPEIHQEKSLVKSIISFIIFLVALGVMLGFKYLGGE
jgi:zinc and cadmium transporter